MCRQLRATTSLVGELLRLAARRGLFNDPAAQIGELTPTIRANIKTMEGQLQNFAAAIGRFRLARNALAHWTGVLDIMKAQAVANAERLRKALKTRSAALAEQASRRQKLSANQWVSPAAMESPLFAAPTAPAVAPPTAPPVAPRPAAVGVHAGPPLGAADMPAPFRAAAAAAAGAHLRRRGGAGGGAAAPPAPAGGAFPQDRYSAQKIAAHKEAKARLADARAVEGTIVELGEMMGRLGSLVATQGETLDSIADDVGAAGDTVEAARAELYKLFTAVAGDRGLILKSLGVVALVIVLFVVFK